MKARTQNRSHDIISSKKSIGSKEKDEEFEKESVERKLAEKALREQIDRNKQILQTAIDGYFLVNEAGQILEVNPAAGIYGYSQEELVGMNIRALDADEPQKVREDVKRILNEGSARFETSQRCKDGRIVVVEVSIHTVDVGKQKFFCSFFHDITERKQAEQMLKEKEKELQIKNINLEEINTALKVLLKRREEDKIELEKKVMANIDELVNPYIEKMKKSELNESQKAYLSILESNLNDVISQFSLRLSSAYLNFTPTEIKIANLIRLSKTTKEVADLLNVSCKTIEVHRKRIRSKFGIKNKKVNLRSHLSSLKDG
jgi:PAS domain S-box-containing protein